MQRGIFFIGFTSSGSFLRAGLAFAREEILVSLVVDLTGGITRGIIC